MTSEEKPPRLDEPFSFRKWFNHNKGTILPAIFAAVVANAISNVFGGIIESLLRVAAVIVIPLAVLRLITGGANWPRFDRARRGLPRPPPPTEVAPPWAHPAGRGRLWIGVVGTVITVLWGIAVLSPHISEIGGDDSRGREDDTTLLPSPAPTPDEDMSFVGERLADARAQLVHRDVKVRVQARIDLSRPPGTILEQDPDPLDRQSHTVMFVAAGRRQSIELDESFLANQTSAWRQGPQRVFGYAHEQAFYLKDGECIREGGYACDYLRRSPLLAFALGRQFEVFKAVIGFEQQGITDRSLVEVIAYGIGAEAGDTLCIAEVGPTTAPLRLRVDVSGQLRLEIIYRPWRGRQIPVVGSPEGIAIDLGLPSPPVTRARNLLPVPPANPRCFA